MKEIPLSRRFLRNLFWLVLCLFKSFVMQGLTMIGGVVLGPLFASLLADLKSGDLIDYARKRGVLRQLCLWEETLKTIKTVVEKEEDQQRTDESVTWFGDLQNLAYDLEDILDEFNTEAKLESKAGTSKVHNMIRSSLSMLTFVSTAEIKDINERLENIKERMKIFKLGTNESKIQVKEAGAISVTSSEVNKAYIYGREDDLKSILEQLKLDGGDGRMIVVPIVGMGGVGKTTLAQLVYNVASLEFDYKAWVTVGESFDVLTITKAILRQFGSDLPEDFSSLQKTLKEKLSGKKALIVLDDVWITNDEYQLWSLFTTPFKEGTPGSRILVTTRNQSVANTTSATYGYDMKGLSSDVCLSILANHAIERKDFDEHPHLKEISEQIAKRCDGLPLAAKALGGVLRGKQITSSWEGVLNNKIWTEGKSVFQALELSYHHLPSHLKRCFGYTAIFPKDYAFDKTRLVPLWMAEGFVEKMKDGYKYFDELLARSLFQKSSFDESLYVMHDFLNDLARSISGDICFNLDEEKEKLCSKVRYSAFTCHKYDLPQRFERFHEMKRLRTFLPLRDQSFSRCYLSPTVLDLITNKLKYLRVLALPYAIRELPNSIDCLKHLRCLDLSYSDIRILPESLCKLFNLKALILFECRILYELPKGFCNLINLQFLDIRGTYRLKKMPLRIGDLKNLHILGKFVVGRSDGSRMLELLKIPNFQGRQHISGLQNVKNVEDAKNWNMAQLEGIDGLTLEWSDMFDDSRNEKNEEEVLSALKPQKNIMQLSIDFYGGRELPSWIGDPSFGKMKILRFKNCYNVALLPALSQLPSLEDLTLSDMNEIKEMGMTLYGNVPSSADVFPSLKILRILNMEKLYEWSNYKVDEGRGQVFSKLKILRILSVEKLYEWSNYGINESRWHVFPKLKKLELWNCPKLEVCNISFPVLDELIVKGCKEVVLRSLPNIQSLTKLEIGSIEGLESFDRAFLETLVSLQEMKVGNCGELKHLWDVKFNMNRLSHLKILEIDFCDELVSLVEEDGGNFPLNLQRLSVQYCKKLEKLPNQLQGLTSLTYLAVDECPKLEKFPPRGLSYSVKRVRVLGCDSLVSLGEGIIVDISNSGHLSQIEELTIARCKSLNLPSNLGFPASLRDLHIESSPVEAQLLRSLQLPNAFSHLTSLSIRRCPNLESFPDTTPSIPTLLHLSLWECEKLRSLPNHINQFMSLQTLYMYDCPEVASFPEGGLPTNLKQLHIFYCDKLESKVLLQQSLNALTCLKELTIQVGGGMDDVGSFPYDSLLLPTSLSFLRIAGFGNLKSISSGIKRLTSLEQLTIKKCPRLRSLPRVASLGHLEIYECPNFEKQVRNRKGDFWHLAASVPSFKIRDYGYDPPERLRK